MVSHIVSAIIGCAALLHTAAAIPAGQFAQLNRDAKAPGTQEQGTVSVQQSNANNAAADNSTAGFRFYNQNTAPFRVTSLPDVPFNLGEFYSGLMPIKSGDTSRELFFIFQPTIGAPVDELTIWLNGGPGCSSLEGFFQENGLFLWKEGTSAPAINPYSWVNMTNMLWVEQPVGTGYSVGTPTATNEEQIANDFVGFLGDFQKTFGISNFKIYVTGESYAGRYVPYISNAILDQNDATNFDLGGALVYDPCIGKFDYVQEQVPTYDFVRANNNLFKFSTSFLNQLHSMHTSCGYDKFLSTYLQFPPPGKQPAIGSISRGCDIFDTAYNQAQQINSCFNIYEINQTCPTPQDVMSDNIFPTSSGGKTNYFNRDDVKAALHAPSSVQWSECSNNAVFVGQGGPEGEGDTSPDPIQGVLPRVIEATNRVLVANGDYDMIIITNGTLLSIQNMTWNGALGFQSRPSTPITAGDGGIQHYERGLMWGQTYKSGHMGPEYQPAVSWRHLEWLLGKVDSL